MHKQSKNWSGVQYPLKAKCPIVANFSMFTEVPTSGCLYRLQSYNYTTICTVITPFIMPYNKMLIVIMAINGPLIFFPGSKKKKKKKKKKKIRPYSAESFGYIRIPT